MANKSFLSSSVSITDVNKSKSQKLSIKDKEINFIKEKAVSWDNANIKKLEPNFKIKPKVEKKKTISNQGVIRKVNQLETSTENNKEKLKLEDTNKELDFQILTPKKTKIKAVTTKEVNNKPKTIRNNADKFKNYGNIRESVNEIDLLLNDPDNYYEEYDDYGVEYYDNQIKIENNTENTQKKLKVIFLGGVGEIGKNMTALEYDDEIIIIDCGSSFPDDNYLGIDLVVPDITYLLENLSKVKGIVLTHGHEDHIGALPYVLDRVNVPIYGSKLTLGLVENKFNEKNFKNVTPTLICIEKKKDKKHIIKGKKIEERNVFQIGKYFKVEFIPVCHSIAGSMALYIQTPQINVLHSGDFKIDFTPIGNVTTDLTRFAELGKSGIDLLLCESTNIDRKGFSMSESTVGKTLEDIFIKNIKRRIVIATFASNISRLQQILTLCEKYKRKVVFTGRSMISVTEIASSKEINELKFNKKIIVDLDNISNYKDEELVILCTGSQGEYRSALSRMAIEDFPKINLGNNDTVIISASPIPGNEKSINNTINNLYKIGCEVIYSELADVHVSGHACQEEIKTIHNLIKPKFFIPVHGEYRHLRHHKDLALGLGMQEENVLICENGSCIEVTSNGLKSLENVPSGIMFVDGLGLGDAESVVLKERSVLANEGICVVLVCVSKATSTLVGEPYVVTRGLIYEEESSALIQEAKQILKDKICKQNYTKYEQNKVKNDIKKEMQKFFVRATNRKPMILTIILEKN